jgi:hypothetical protein
MNEHDLFGKPVSLFRIMLWSRRDGHAASQHALALRRAIALNFGLTTHAARLSRLAQANAAAAIFAADVLADQFHAGAIERVDDLGQRIHHATDVASGGFHPLDGRQRHAGQLGQGFLIYPEQRTRGPHLERRDHDGLTWYTP